MSAHLSLEGVPQFEAALEGIVGDARRSIVKPALRQAGELVRDEIKSRANFGPYSRGDRGVRGSIIVQETQVGGEPSVVVKPDKRRGGGGRAAHLAEFPIPPHAAKYYGRPAQHPGTRGQPFFNPGVEAKQEAAMDLIERALLDGAAKHWESAGGGSE